MSYDAQYDALKEAADLQRRKAEALQALTDNEWCLIPPNQECSQWTLYRNFDGEFGYNDELTCRATALECIEAAMQAEGKRGMIGGAK